MDDEENKGNQNSFIQKIFNCCFNHNREDFELKKDEDLTDNQNSLLIKARNELESEFSLFSAGEIREEERETIEFTKEGLLKFILNLQNLNYSNIYDSNNIKISKRNSSFISDKSPLIKCEVIKNKSYFTKVPDIQKIIDAMTKPELRKKWDNNIKEYKIIQKIGNNSEIIKTITNKIFGVIPEKELYDKRIKIINNGIYYLFSSSIPDSTNFISLDYDKAINYICIRIVREDDKNFYFNFFNQIDINIDLPENFIDTNLPNKAKSFFEKYFEFLNNI